MGCNVYFKSRALTLVNAGFISKEWAVPLSCDLALSQAARWHLGQNSWQPVLLATRDSSLCCLGCGVSSHLLSPVPHSFQVGALQQESLLRRYSKLVFVMFSCTLRVLAVQLWFVEHPDMVPLSNQILWRLLSFLPKSSPFPPLTLGCFPCYYKDYIDC